MFRTIFALALVATTLGLVACALRLNGTGPADVADSAVVDASTTDAAVEGSIDATPSDAGCEAGCRPTPVDLVAGGNHYCIRTAAGEIYCWGRNDSAQLGLGDTMGRWKPTRVSIDADGGVLPSISRIDPGASHTCVVSSDGSVYCAGQNYWGQLGQPLTLAQSARLMRISGILATDVSAGGSHTCVIDQSAKVQCWGRNDDGELGYVPGSRVDAGEARCVGSSAWCNPNPTIAGLTDAPLGLGLLYESSCAIIAGGAVKCWGSNSHGALGSMVASTSVPTIVSIDDGGALLGATAVGGFYLSACSANGPTGAFCWGYAIYGNLANPPNAQGDVTPAKRFGTLADVGATAAGLAHSCAVASGRVHCTGWNGEGAVGNGALGGDAGCPAFANGQAPDQCVASIVDVGLTFVRSIAAASTSTCVLTTQGKVLCWGENYFGELGHPPGSSGDLSCAGSEGNGMSHCNPLPTEVVFGP